jgi:hypothetical protein
MASKRSGKEVASSQEDLKQRRKHQQRIMTSSSKITSKRIGIKLLSINLYILVGTPILILRMS